MTAALALLVGAVGVLVWRPCQSSRGAAPRSAVALLLATGLGVWVGSFGLVATVIGGNVGGTLTACAALWRQLLAGQLAGWETAFVAGWLVALPGRGIAVLVLGGVRSRRLARTFRAVGVTPACGASVPARTFIVPGLSTTAITLGVLRPVILINDRFWRAASPTQRRVVIAHEHGHRRGRHVLIDGAARLLLAGLRPLPSAATAYDCIRRHLEALADDAAVRTHDAHTVGVEIGRIALSQPPEAGLGASGAALWRVQRLLEPRTRHLQRISVVILAAILSLGVVVVLGQSAHALGPPADAQFCPV